MKYCYTILLLLFSFSTFAQTESDQWWNETVFYEIFVRSFYDSDGDGIGDFNGLTQKLDYLNDGDPATDTDLGIKGIWLMPISQSPSYHGYDVLDYRSIESDYGTMADFRTFLDSAHARGIKVIIDLVINHSSAQHPWFLDSRSSLTSPKRDWYSWSPLHPGDTGPWGQNVWHYDNQSNQYYFGLFWDQMPDLNHANPEVKQETFDIVEFWLDSIQVDGFRIDAIKHLFENGPIMQHAPATFPYLQDLRTFYKGVNPNALTVGEVWDNADNIGPYADGDKLDMCFEFDLAGAIINSVNTQVPDFSFYFDEIAENYIPNQYATFLTNHDMNRVFHQLNGDMNKARLAASLLLTFPGVPFLYYGEELAMTGAGPDEFKRRPMQWASGTQGGFTSGTPWQSLTPGFGANNVSDMESDPISLLSLYKKLIHLRNGFPALQKGAFKEIQTASAPQSLYAFTREYNNQLVIALANFSDVAASGYTLSMTLSSVGLGTFSVQELLTGASAPALTINSDGGFINWNPMVSVPGKSIVLLHPVTPLTSIGDGIGQDWVKVFPNPVSDRLFVELAGSLPADIELADQTGRRVLTSRLHVPESIIDVSNLSGGIYFLTVRSGDQLIRRKLIRR